MGATLENSVKRNGTEILSDLSKMTPNYAIFSMLTRLWKIYLRRLEKSNCQILVYTYIELLAVHVCIASRESVFAATNLIESTTLAELEKSLPVVP